MSDDKLLYMEGTKWEKQPTFPTWLFLNWTGIAIECHDWDLVHHVPGWGCNHCDYKIGTLELPPEKCPECNNVGET